MATRFLRNGPRWWPIGNGEELRGQQNAQGQWMMVWVKEGKSEEVNTTPFANGAAAATFASALAAAMNDAAALDVLDLSSVTGWPE